MRNAVFYSILIIGFLTSGMIFAAGKATPDGSIRQRTSSSKTDGGVFISWRLSGNERDAAFNVYKNGKLFKSLSAGEATSLTDSSGKPSDKYVVRTIVNGKETSSSKEVTPWAEEFLIHPDKSSARRNNSSGCHLCQGQTPACDTEVSGRASIYVCSG